MNMQIPHYYFDEEYHKIKYIAFWINMQMQR